MLMKPLLIFLLILISFKGAESNHLNSKYWPSRSDYHKVNYDHLEDEKLSNKLYLKIVYLLKDYSIFNDFSYKVTNEILEYKCHNDHLPETFVLNYVRYLLEYVKKQLYNCVTIEKCLEYQMNSSPNNIESLIEFIKINIPTLSISKTLPNEHNLTINDFIEDQSFIKLQRHVKFALLYVDEENYYLKTDDKLTTHYKEGKTEKQPTLYIIYDTVLEKKEKLSLHRFFEFPHFSNLRYLKENDVFIKICKIISQFEDYYKYVKDIKYSDRFKLQLDTTKWDDFYNMIYIIERNAYTELSVLSKSIDLKMNLLKSKNYSDEEFSVNEFLDLFSEISKELELVKSTIKRIISQNRSKAIGKYDFNGSSMEN
jgi:hypothetical protein